MPENVKIVRVFIGSPGGLETERRAAHEIVQEVNQAHSEHWGCQIKLIGWEDTIPGYQRAQSAINQDLDKCQYFIGVLWNKWGSKPDLDPNGYTSGFEEEFRRAQDLVKIGSMKDIALYFKQIIIPSGLEAGSEIRKVQSFRAECIEGKFIFFKDFGDINQFRDYVRSKISEIGWREFKANSETSSDNSDAEQSPRGRSSTKSTGETRLLERQAVDFMALLSARTADSEQTTASEIARLRLLGSSLYRTGNDETHIGNHDANLLFRFRKEMDFSQREIRTLVDCGVAGFHQQNVPLWAWLSASYPKSEPFQRLDILSLVGSNDEMRNAIRLLQITGRKISQINSLFTKKDVFTIWFGNESERIVSDAASEYLSEVGDFEDISFLKEIALEALPEKRKKIHSTISEIISNYSNNEALGYIVSEGVESIGKKCVARIFLKTATLSTPILQSAIAAKPDEIRLRVVTLLAQRGELAEADANNLLSDSNHDVRIQALESLRTAGKLPPNETIQTILTVQKGGANALLKGSGSDTLYYDFYMEERLRDLSVDELNNKIESTHIFDDKELFALYSKEPKTYLSELRMNLADNFVQRFNNSIEKFQNRFGSDDEYRKKLTGLWDYYQAKLCTNALAIIGRYGDEGDIELVRKVLDEVQVDLSANLLNYLGKNGSWNDIKRIERLKTYSTRRYTHSQSLFYDFFDEKAEAIYRIGRGRIIDLLQLDLTINIRKCLVNILPSKTFGDMSDDFILKQLDDKDDDYRALFAIRCVATLPKERVSRLLDNYVDRETHRYYNSIHWLDLGASFPRKVAASIAMRELARRS